MATEPRREDPEEIEPLLAALGGKYAARILAATEEPKSAKELSRELDVPIATCYRRIEDLEEAGLLVCEGRETSDRGRRTRVYRRTLDGLALDLRAGDPELSLDACRDRRDTLRDRRDG